MKAKIFPPDEICMYGKELRRLRVSADSSWEFKSVMDSIVDASEHDQDYFVKKIWQKTQICINDINAYLSGTPIPRSKFAKMENALTEE
jgi:hypothetical protein